jgi:hypothetical protein
MTRDHTPAFPPHVWQNALVFDDYQLVYIPMPKAGSTAILWALADLAELQRDAFEQSLKLEMTRALTVHDMSIWGKAHRLDKRRIRDARRLFESENWLTFTFVREPVRRLWSAWVSKILIRDPRFVAAFGAEDWFPDVPVSADDIVASFRRFVRVLPERPASWHDPHWSSQHELLGMSELQYGVVGRVEDLPAALAPIDAHLGNHGRDGLQVRRENESLLSFVPELLESDDWERCEVFTRRDREAFGYDLQPRPRGDVDERWIGDAELQLPALQAVVERNERIGDLKHVATSSRAF